MRLERIKVSEYMRTKGRKEGEKQERSECWRRARCGQTQEVRVEFQQCSLFSETLPSLTSEASESSGRTGRCHGREQIPAPKTETRSGGLVGFGRPKRPLSRFKRAPRNATRMSQTAAQACGRDQPQLKESLHKRYLMWMTASLTCAERHG